MSFFNVSKVLFFLFFATGLSAQPWFSWDYTGPDTITVGANCKAPLNWGGQNSVKVLPLNPPNQVVISKLLKSISGGFFEGSLVPAGTTVTVTYEAMDNQGHTEEFSFNIYFADKTPPVFNPNSLPPDITISCAINLNQPAITASDNCTPGFQIEISSALNFPPSPCSGSYQRTFTAKDLAGNTTQYIQNITLIGETIPPVITTEAQNSINNCSVTNAGVAFQQWIQSQGGAIASDNCGLGGWTTIPANPVFNNTCNTPTVVQFVVSDFCGNKDTTSASFSVVDTISPILNGDAENLIIGCSSDPESSMETWLNNAGEADVTDNCVSEADLLKTYIYNGSPVTIAELQQILEDQLNGPVQTVVIDGITYENVRAALDIQFIIADYCGHEVNTDAVFAVLDSTAPVIITPGVDTTTVSCALGTLDEDFTEWYNSGAGAAGSDLCGPVTWSGVPSLVDALEQIHAEPLVCNQTISVTFRAKDSSGNESADTFISVYKIFDSTGPSFVVRPEDYQQVCSGEPGLQDTLEAWINSQAGASIEDCNGSDWDHFEWVDNEGNTGQGTFDAGPYPQISGNGCDQFINTFFFAKDNCDNISIDSARFNLGDNEAPVAINVPTDTIINCGETLPMGVPDFTDNCALSGTINFTQSSTQDDNPFACNHYNYTITKTWQAQDECGNETIVTQIIGVQDTLAPKPDMPFTDLDLDCTFNPDDYLINFSDACSEVEIDLVATSDQGSDPALCNFYNYTLTETVTVKDVCQNTGIYTRVLNISDTQAPEVDNSETLTLNCMDSVQIANIVQSLASDNCANEMQFDIQRLTNDSTALDCSTGYLQLWVLTATDPCGNSTEDTIKIKLIDNDAPVIQNEAAGLTFYCSDVLDINTIINSWVADAGGAAAADACGETFMFVALADSYKIDDPSTFPGKLPDAGDILDCVNNSVQFMQIDVVFYDVCDNASVSSAIFQILDTIPPAIVFCPVDTVIIAAEGDCDAVFSIDAPGILDQCGNTSIDSTILNSINVVSDNPGNSLTPVNNAIITYDDFTVNGTFATYAPGGLTVTVQNGDVEGDTEFFNIYDENGELIGLTDNSDVQCGNSTTIINYSEAQFNSWISDGIIQFHFEPNDPSPLDGGFAVNDICSGTRIETGLPVKWNQNNSLQYSYKVDTGNIISYDPGQVNNITLKEGDHTISYFVSDCSGEQVTCIQNVEIRDTVAPEIVCGDDINITLSQQRCDTLLQIPLPVSISDNCGLANDFEFNVPSDTASAWLTFAANPNLQNYIAQDKTYTFTNVGGNVTNPVLLNIFIQGDVDSGGEYFTIIGEDDQPLGITEAGLGNVLTGSCSKVSVIYYNIPAATFNEWAIDGSITFKAISNIDFTIPPGNELSGINPCQPNSINADGQTDSTSFMFMQLKYTSFTPPYYYATGSTDIPLTQLPPPFNPPAITFNAGETFFSYVIEDISGNRDTCTISVNVLDTLPPTAICKNAIVHVHPSGVIPAILTPDMVDDGSYDNCTIDTMFVTPSTFTCTDIGSQIEVTLFVQDNSGLIDSCTTIVRIDEAILDPAYSLGLCDNDTLRLFANLPDLDIFDQYTYSWTGPNSFSSNLANPVIPQATALNSGTYTLSVTGFNNCGGSGVVQVFINDEINTPIIGALDSTVCSGTDIVLFTQPYTGNIQYKWYEGTAPGGTLLDSTIVPQYAVDRPLGDYLFYVIITENDCISNPSASLAVEVIESPVAIVDDEIIEVCEGGVISLGTPLIDLKYKWTGPNGFNSDLQYPPAINPATLQDAGVYTLIVSSTDCSSEPVFVTVNVSKRPDRPAPTSNSPVCSNNELRLTSNIIANVDSFIWKRPDGQIITTSSNPLVIASAGTDDNGLWTLILKSGGCISLESLPVNIVVTQEAPVTINYNGPVCEGDSVLLSTNPYPGATFSWTGPAGFISSLATPKVKAALGVYSVTVTTSVGCIATGSISLELNPKPRIINLTTDAENCHFPDEAINFSYNITLPEEELSFFWKGPGGFVSTDAHPVIIPGQFTNGIYSLVVVSDLNCSSDTARVTIAVTLAPSTPIVQGATKVCSGDTILLTVVNHTNAGQFIWSTPAGDFITTVNNFSVLNAQQLNGGSYTVTFEENGCVSKPSIPFVVDVTNTPDRPVIIGDPTVCLNDSIVLEISNSPDYTYAWTGPGGISSSQKKWVIHPAQTANAGNYFLTLINDGCASPVSDAFQLVINLPPTAPTLVDPVSSICVNEDNAVLTLCVTNGSATPGANYTFYNSTLSAAVGGPTNALCTNVTDFTGFNNGNNDFYAIATLNTCPSSQSVPVTVLINRPPEESAVTGKIKYVCEGNSTSLQATPVNQAIGHWEALTAGVVIANPLDPVSQVSNLASGQNIFVWSLDYIDCINYSNDTMIIWVPGTIEAGDDIYRMKAGEQPVLEVISNDQFNTPITIELVNNPSFGTIEILNDQSFIYNSGGQSDYDKFTYRICVAGCPALCSEAEVLIDVDAVNDCMVPNIITPNNDRVNDVLRISCLDDQSQNNSKLVIFNEWGSLIYEASPYLNNWDGKYKGTDLPSGTYFYVFDMGDQSSVQKGFLIIKR